MEPEIPPECLFPPLAERYDRALRDVVAWISANLRVRAILATGSIIRGNPSRSSDLDLHVIHAEPWRQRIQRWSGDVPCEIFVNPLERVSAYFPGEQLAGRPCTAHMIATGFDVFDPERLLPPLRDEAEQWLRRPPTVDADGLTQARYAAACVVEDALDVADSDPVTALYLAGIAVEKILRYRFLSRGRLVPRPKDLFAVLESDDLPVAQAARHACAGDSFEQRMSALRELAATCLGVTGFFAWESDRSA